MHASLSDQIIIIVIIIIIVQSGSWVACLPLQPLSRGLPRRLLDPRGVRVRVSELSSVRSRVYSCHASSPFPRHTIVLLLQR